MQQLGSEAGQQQPVSTFVSCNGAIAIGSWRMVHWIDVLAKGEEVQLALSTHSPTGRVQLPPHKGASLIKLFMSLNFWHISSLRLTLRRANERFFASKGSIN